MSGVLAVMERPPRSWSSTSTDGRRGPTAGVGARRLDEVGERPQEAAVPAPHELVVPLHPRRVPAAVRALERLDDAVPCADGRLEPRPSLGDALVVERV